MNKKRKVWSIIGFIILGGFVIFYIVRTITDLVSLGNAEKIDANVMDIREAGKSVKGEFYWIDYSEDEKPILTREHSINGLIPTGNEYYFILYSNDGTKAIYVRADKNFASDFISSRSEGVDGQNYKPVFVKGRIREMDYSRTRDLAHISDGLVADGIEVLKSGIDNLYLDLTTDFQCTMRIITIFAFMGAGVLFFISMRRRTVTEVSVVDTVIVLIAVVLLLGGICTMLYTMNFLF